MHTGRIAVRTLPSRPLGSAEDQRRRALSATGRDLALACPNWQHSATLIIGRSPLRISLGGGGTDLPSYYRRHGGFVLAAAITKYVYVSMHETEQPEMLLRYSQTERPTRVDDVRHPIIRETLRLTEIAGPNIEITSMADIPTGGGATVFEFGRDDAVTTRAVRASADTLDLLRTTS